jgi:hypothetical protein
MAITLASLMIFPASLPAQTPAAPSANTATVRHAQPIRDAIRKEAVRLARTSRQAAAPQPPRHRNWFARHPVLTGAMAGAGVGMILITANGCNSSSDYTCTGLLLFGGGTGAAIGSAGGLVAAIILR